ncbi:hypothetical protein [Clostridium tetani]|uniref:hypothetical protein n=1 Tax=Clostridium tetani TaxID=1513 RepID=UPI00100B94CE|nr:hypothetical protein [Clostridium tetani]WFN63234.1 hypothetical protein PAA20_02810 [Clostridium tetani]
MIDEAQGVFFVGWTLLLKRYSLKLIIKIFKEEKENYEKEEDVYSDHMPYAIGINGNYGICGRG